MSISNLRRSLIFRRRLLGDNDSTTASYQSRSGRTAVPALLEIEYTEESSQVTLTSVEDGTTEDRLELEMENDYASMLKGLRASFGSGRTKTLEWRVRQLQGLIRMYDENTSAFVMALHKDLRKPRMEALGSEVDFLKNDALSCLRDIKEWMAPRPARKNTVSLLDRVETRPEPYGVALIIGAWNYPLHLTLAPLSGAIAAGNCAVVKPSEISPHTAKAVEELLPKYLDPLCFKVKKNMGKCNFETSFHPGICPGCERRRARDDRAVEAALRLHLLHREHRRGQDHRQGGGRPPHPVHPGAGREEPCLRQRRMPADGHGRQEAAMGQVHQRRTGENSTSNYTIVPSSSFSRSCSQILSLIVM